MNTKPINCRRSVVTSIAFAALLTAAGCASSDPNSATTKPSAPAPSAKRDAGPPSADSFAPLVLAGADEASNFQDFKEMVAGSDAVVTGKFERFEAGRVFQADSPEDVLYYIDGVFQVEDFIHGSGDQTIQIEFLSSAANKDQVQTLISDLPDATGSGISVAFLHDKQGQEEQGLVRLSSSYGLVTATDRAPVDVPLGEVPPAPLPRLEVQAPSATWKSMDDFIGAVKDM